MYVCMYMYVILATHPQVLNATPIQQQQAASAATAAAAAAAAAAVGTYPACQNTPETHPALPCTSL